jgi:hypothetical protein
MAEEWPGEGSRVMNAENCGCKNVSGPGGSRTMGVESKQGIEMRPMSMGASIWTADRAGGNVSVTQSIGEPRGQPNFRAI